MTRGIAATATAAPAIQAPPVEPKKSTRLKKEKEASKVATSAIQPAVTKAPVRKKTAVVTKEVVTNETPPTKKTSIFQSAVNRVSAAVQTVITTASIATQTDPVPNTVTSKEAKHTETSQPSSIKTYVKAAVVGVAVCAMAYLYHSYALNSADIECKGKMDGYRVGVAEGLTKLVDQVWVKALTSLDPYVNCSSLDKETFGQKISMLAEVSSFVAAERK